MKKLSFPASVAGGALLCACLTAIAQTPLTPTGALALEDFERAAASASTQSRIHAADLSAQQAQVDAARAQTGARVFANTGLNRTREAVTEDTTRDYNRLQGQVGVRWPLLGEREAQLNTVRDAQGALATAQAQSAVSERQVLRQIRTAYVSYVRSDERRAIAEAFLAYRKDAQAQIQRRTRAGEMLPAEGLDAAALFDDVETLRKRQEGAQTTALRTLRRLAARPDAQAAAVPPAWRVGCFQRDALIGSAANASPQGVASAQVDAARKRLSHSDYFGMRAGVQVAQSLSKDMPGRSGRNTSVSVDVSIPLQWRAARNAHQTQAQQELARSEASLELAREQVEAGVDSALQDRDMRRGESAARERRRAAAQEGLRVAELRLSKFDGDGYAKVLAARSALYQAALELSAAWELQELADIALLSYTDGCDTGPAESMPRMGAASLTHLTGTAAAGERENGGSPAALALVASELPVSAMSAKAESNGTFAKRDAAATTSSGGFGFFVWKGQALVEAPERLNRLPAGTQRLLLSFSAAQINGWAQPDQGRRLNDFLSAAKERGVSIELLMGEPTWVSDAGRTQLLTLIGQARSFPFAALNLDIERDQLPKAQHAQWSKGALATLKAAADAAPWPVAFTTHPRDLRNGTFLQQLAAAGVKEVVPMIFVARPERTAEIATALIAQVPGMHVAVAQSIEPQLPAEETSAPLGQSAALNQWSRLGQLLSNQGAFSGVLVQSLEDFEKARP